MTTSPLDADLGLAAHLESLCGPYFDRGHAAALSPDPLVRATAGPLFETAWALRNASLTVRRLKARPTGWWG